MTVIKELCLLECGQKAYVECVRDDCAIKNRLADLGFTEGASVRPLLGTCGKSMRAYEICGAVIALRREDARCVEVRA